LHLLLQKWQKRVDIAKVIYCPDCFEITSSETVLLSIATSCVRVGIFVFSELSCCLREVAIDGKSLWRYPHVSAIFAEVNATVKSERKWESVQVLFEEKFINFANNNAMAMIEGQVFNALKLGPGQTLEDYTIVK
jgi:hypothetical protein